MEVGMVAHTRKLRQDDNELKISLKYRERPCLKTKNIKQADIFEFEFKLFTIASSRPGKAIQMRPCLNKQTNK